MVHMISSWRSCGVEDVGRWVDATGYIELLYPNFVVFIVLGPRAFQSFSLLVGHINRTQGGWGSLPLLLFSLCIS
jgi:hypothetical protein